MIDRKNRYGFTAARIHNADGRSRRPSSTTIDIHSHIFVREAAKVAQPHIDISRISLAYFADNATKAINAAQEKDIMEVMTTIDRRLHDLDKMGIDIQVVAPAPGQCYYHRYEICRTSASRRQRWRGGILHADLIGF